MSRRILKCHAVTWIAVALGLGSAEAHGQGIDEIAAEELNAFRPGIVVALRHNNELQILEAYGVADTLRGAPLEPADLFAYPALSEIVLALAVEGLHVAGVLDQDAPLSTYLPGLSPGLGQSTLRQLLSNTAGLDDANRLEGESWEKTLDRLDDLALVSEPGFGYSRSRHSFPLAARVLSTVVGHPFSKVAEEAVLRPLGLESSTFDLAEARRRGLILGVEQNDDASGPTRDVEATAIHDGLPVLFTTARDVVTLLAAWNEGRLVGRPPSELGVQTPLSVRGDRRFGAGVWIDEFRGLTRVSRTANALGIATAFHLFPEMGTTVFLWTRGRSSHRIQRLLLDAVAEAANAPPARAVATDSAGASARIELDPERWAGTYRNGELIFVLREADGRLVLFNGSEELPLEAAGTTRVVARLPDGRIALGLDLLMDDAGRRYVHYTGRLYRHEDNPPVPAGG